MANIMETLVKGLALMAVMPSVPVGAAGKCPARIAYATADHFIEESPIIFDDVVIPDWHVKCFHTSWADIDVWDYTEMELVRSNCRIVKVDEIEKAKREEAIEKAKLIGLYAEYCIE